MKLFKAIWRFITDCQFRIIFGMWPKQITKLYIKLISRDDEEFNTVRVNGKIFGIKNSAIMHNKSYLSIGGDYDGKVEFSIATGRFNGTPVIVMEYPKWQDFGNTNQKAEWFQILKFLVEYYE